LLFVLGGQTGYGDLNTPVSVDPVTSLMQRYCKSREIQKKRKFIFISEMQRIFMVLCKINIMQIIGSLPHSLSYNIDLHIIHKKRERL